MSIKSTTSDAIMYDFAKICNDDDSIAKFYYNDNKDSSNYGEFFIETIDGTYEYLNEDDEWQVMSYEECVVAIN